MIPFWYKSLFILSSGQRCLFKKQTQWSQPYPVGDNTTKRATTDNAVMLRKVPAVHSTNLFQAVFSAAFPLDNRFEIRRLNTIYFSWFHRPFRVLKWLNLSEDPLINALCYVVKASWGRKREIAWVRVCTLQTPTKVTASARFSGDCLLNWW